MKTFYLMRHGKPELLDEQRRFIGQLDIPLGAEGYRQGKAQAERLQSRNIQAVFCSDLIRSVETARCIAEPYGFEPIPLTGLREINLGKWEGETFSEIARVYPKEFKARGMDIAHFRPPQGESFADCSHRAMEAFRFIADQPYERIAVVGHAGVNRGILCHILGMPLQNLFRIVQDYGCLNVIHMTESACHIKTLNLSP